MSRFGKRLALLACVMVPWSLAVRVAEAESPRGNPGVPPRMVTEGALLWRTMPEGPFVPAPVLETDVDMRVTGIVVRAAVRQRFANPSSEWAEGIYVFPLPEDAAVDHMRMRVGDRTIEGSVRERLEAKATYEQARREGKRASLVEQERSNVFTTSVANIPPGASIVVEIEYQHAARYGDAQFRLRFPMVVGPRYIPRGTPDASRIAPPVAHPARGPLNPVRLRVELDAGVPLDRLEATYHAVRTSEVAAGRYRIELAEGPVPADRDFELVWRPAVEVAPAAALLTEAKGEEVFALLMLMPPAPSTTDGVRVPREVVFVIDTSGSMHGPSIEQAKAALRLALARLQPADTFEIVRFNDQTDSLFGGAASATPGNRQRADRYVGALRAEGGTEMLPALLRALDGQEQDGRLRQVIFLTDGSVGNEQQLFEVIRDRLGDSRLFTIGIGSAPNSHFMRETARLGRGTFTHIGSTAEVQAKMVALFRRIESPALTDVHLELPGAAQAEILPERIPDLYLGEPVTVALRAATLPSTAVLRGRLGSAPWEQEVFFQQVEGAGVSVHWARAKIAALLDSRRSGAPDDDVRRAVVEVALAHHLVSPYTSFVAVDVTPVRPENAGVVTHALETNLPHGWDETAVFGLGQGATGGPLHVAVGLGALLLAAMLYVSMRLDVASGARGRDGRAG